MTLQQNDIAFLGAVTASCSHEIKNALAVMAELGGLIEDETLGDGTLNKEEFRGYAATLKEQVHKANQTIQKLHELAHCAQKNALTNLEFSSTLDTTLFFLKPIAAKKKIALTATRPPKSFYFISYALQIQQALFLCIRHALDLSVPNGQVTVSASPLENPSKIDVLIEFTANQESKSPLLPADLELFLNAKATLNCSQPNQLTINLQILPCLSESIELSDKEIKGN
jgi:signal transduction histidine kinase